MTFLAFLFGIGYFLWWCYPKMNSAEFAAIVIIVLIIFGVLGAMMTADDSNDSPIAPTRWPDH